MQKLQDKLTRLHMEQANDFNMYQRISKATLDLFAWKTT